jgi:surfactin synthase thioesterase subunit
LHAVTLPGRMALADEPFIQNMGALIDELVVQLEAALTSPYVIFGHSMGGIVGVELVWRLQQSGYPLPETLVLAATPAPGSEPVDGLHRLDDAGMLREIQRLFGGFSEADLADPAIRELVIPPLRADFELIERHRISKSVRLSVPVVGLRGRADNAIGVGAMDGWANFAPSGFALRELDGGHFFPAFAATDFRLALARCLRA